MRRCGTVANPEAAARLADYLLAQDIRVRFDPQPNEVIVWAVDEDRIDEAREIVEHFNAHPQDERYLLAARQAEQVRRQEIQRQKEFQKNYVDVKRRWQKPPAQSAPLTFILILASIGVFYATDYGFEPKPQPILNSLLITDVRDATGFPRELTSIREHHQVWRLVTPIFIHFGIMHIAFNMIMLYQLGLIIESRRGTVRFGAMVLLIAIISNLSQWYWGFIGERLAPGYFAGVNPYFGGMSGVIYGLFGYAWMKSRYSPQTGIYVDPNTVIILVGWLILCMTPFTPMRNIANVANAAHLGGLLAGMAVGYAPVAFKMRR